MTNPLDTKPDVVLRSEHVTICYDSQHKIIHYVMRRGFRGDEYRNALTRCVECMEQHGASKWLADVRDHFMPTQADQEWARQVWFPSALRAGWEHCAVVKPELAVVALYANRMMEILSAAGITCKLVDTTEAGLHWLRRVKEGRGAPPRTGLSEKR